MFIKSAIEGCVIVINHDHQLIQNNPNTQEALVVGNNNPTGKHVREVIHHQEFLSGLGFMN